MIKIDYFVGLDSGHSFYSSGKATPKFDDGTVMHEWEFNFAVVEKVFNKLKPYSQIDVFLTNTEKYDVTLDNRCDRVNRAWQAYQDKFGKEKIKGVLVSVHANAMKDYWNDLGNGTSTFYYPTNMIDKVFAEVIQKNLIAKTKLKPHRGGVVGENFQMVRDVNMTACLCECAFMDNLEEAKLLRTDEFREACAEGIVNGLLEYFGIAKIVETVEVKEEVIENKPVEKVNETPVEIKTKVIYTVSPNKTYQLCGDVKDFGVKIVNQKNRTIEESNITNGSFFWNLADGNKYSTSILYANGITYQYNANHLPSPQSVFIIYKDNTVGMKRLYNLGEIDLSNVKIAIGGIGLVNKMDSTFKYSPSKDGFSGKYVDVLRKTNKTVLGYSKSENKLYLMCRPNIIHSSMISFDLLDLVVQCKYDVAISFDGGGSTFMNNQTDMVFYGDNRVIHNIIGFNL